MGGSGWVWQVCNFMTQTQPDPLILFIYFFFVTQPNPPSPKNRPNPVGWVGLGWVGFGGSVGFLHTPTGGQVQPTQNNNWIELLLTKIGLKSSQPVRFLTCSAMLLIIFLFC